MIVLPGDKVVYDGKFLIVTDAVDQTALEVCTTPDDLCIGVVMKPEKRAGRTMVFPMGEITGVWS